MSGRLTPRIAPGGQDAKITTCKICGYGVFRGQEWRWSQVPLGIVHLACRVELVPPVDAVDGPGTAGHGDGT